MYTSPAFFLIRDKKTGKYLNSRFEKELSGDITTDHRYISNKNAQAFIRSRQTKGLPVENFEVVPIALLPLDAIPANIKKLNPAKPGYVIKISHPKNRHQNYGSFYWKGNKKEPVLLGYHKLVYGPKSPLSASRFDTLDKASVALDALAKEVQELRSHYVSAGSGTYAAYIDVIDNVNLTIEKV